MRDSELLHVPLPQRLGVPFTLNRSSPQARGLAGWWPAPPSMASRMWNMAGDVDYYFAVPHSSWLIYPGMGLMHDTNNTGVVRTISAPALDFKTGNVTWTAWINPQALNHQGCWFGGDNSGSKFFFCEFTSTGGILFETDDGSGGAFAISTTGSIVTGVLQHIAIVWVRGVNMYFYLNGKPYGSDTSLNAKTASIDGLSRLGLGKRPTNDFPADVYIADIRQYNRALSAAEIAALYNPATRWELYQPLVMPAYKAAAAAASSIPAIYYHRQQQGMS